MAIPIVQVPSLAPTSLNFATPSAQGLAGPAAALGEVARGIAQVGGELGQHAAQVQQMENAFQESEARQKIAGEFAALDLELDRNTDPATYAKRFEETLQRTGKFIQGDTLAPIVRQRLALAHEEIASNQRLRVNERAASMTAKRAALALKNEMEAARTYGDRSAFESAMSRGLEAGLILPEQRDSALMEFDQYAAYDTMAKAIDADPETSLQQLNSEDFQTRYPLITPENRERLQGYATKKSNHLKAETWDQIALAGMEGTILSREDILTMAKEGDISPAQAGSYINAYHGEAAPVHDPLVFESARSQILTYDPANDESGAIRAQMAANIATLALPKESIRELQNQFQARVNPKESDQPKHRLAAEYEKRLDQEWKTEAFGNWFEYEKNPIDGRIAQKIINEKDFDTALSYKDKVTRYFNAWLNQQPDDLDPLDAGKKYNEIKADILKNHTPVDIEIPTFAPIPSFADPLDGTTPDEAPGVLPKPDPKTSSRGTFGGQPIPAPGMFIRGANTTIFGGDADPNDNGLSANGGSNNAIPGVAMPEKMLKAMFPGKDKQWFFDNVKVVVKADNGLQKVLPLVDYGTAEWVTERAKNHVLDLNPKAVAALGGQAIYKNGRLQSHAGFQSVDFAVTTAKAAMLDPKKSTRPELKTSWFQDKKPRHQDQIESGLSALYDNYFQSQTAEI
jgi:hypothetical protein